jgi:hypothetical protein
MSEKKYPIEYSNEEIVEKINSQSKYLMKKDLTPAAAAKYSGRITIGLTELQNRKQNELNNLIGGLNKEINLLSKITTHFSDKQLTSLGGLDSSLDTLNSEVSSLTGSSQQQEFRLDFLGELIHKLNEEIILFRTSSERNAISATKNTRISIGLVVFSALISGMALFFALKDYEGDKVWEQNQINALTELNESIKSLEKSNLAKSKSQDSLIIELKKLKAKE